MIMWSVPWLTDAQAHRLDADVTSALRASRYRPWVQVS
jgi:hypothetical protein